MYSGFLNTNWDGNAVQDSEGVEDEEEEDVDVDAGETGLAAVLMNGQLERDDAAFCNNFVSSVRSTVEVSFECKWRVVAVVCVTTAGESVGLEGTGVSGVARPQR